MLKDRIRKSRKTARLTQTELADAIGSTKQNIYKYEMGIVTNIPLDKIEALAKALDVEPAYLMGWEDDSSTTIPIGYEPLPKTTKVPFRGDIACGVPILAMDDVDEHIDMPAGIKADFALRCKGDSMIGARIFDGDIVYIRSQPEVENGEIAAVEIDGEATLKRVYKIGSPGAYMLELRAENPAIEPLHYSGETLRKVRIDGKAIAFTSKVR